MSEVAASAEAAREVAINVAVMDERSISDAIIPLEVMAPEPRVRGETRAEKYAREQNKPLAAHTEAVLLDTILKYRGRIALAAKAMGVSITTVQSYIRRSPKAQEMSFELKELEKDAVEAALVNAALKKGRVDAQIFYLKTQARDRGYGDHVDVKQTVTRNVKVSFDWSKLDRDGLKKAEAAFKQIGAYDRERAED
jgi:hypothetical protein